MSATIFSIPKRFEKTIPDIFKLRNGGYQEAEKQWISDLEDWIRDNFGAGKYIGRTIRFGVADGYAVYMVKSLSPVELIHLPLMDAYESEYAHLMTASEVKKKIDADDRMEAFMKTQCTVGEVNDFLKEFGTPITDVSDNNHELMMDDHICVKWTSYLDDQTKKEWFVKEDSVLYGEQENKVVNYLKRNFLV